MCIKSQRPFNISFTVTFNLFLYLSTGQKIYQWILLQDYSSQLMRKVITIIQFSSILINS